MRVVLVWCVLVAGCGRLAFDARGDGASGDDGGGDGRTGDAGPCASWSAWSTPVTVAIAGANAHYMGSISDDGLTLMYANYNGATNQDDLYVTTRTSNTAAFGAEQLVTELQTVNNDYNPVTHDGLTVYFASEIGGALPDIFVTTRASATAQFSTPVAVPGINTTGYDASGWVSADGLRIYLVSDALTADIDIYMATRTTTAMPFGTPAPIPELAGPGQDTHPALTADELEIIWSSKRASTRYDLYAARRANRTDPFGSPTMISELTTANDDCYPTLSPDGSTMYLNYDVLTNSGPAPVSMTTRTCQ